MLCGRFDGHIGEIFNTIANGGRSFHGRLVFAACATYHTVRCHAASKPAGLRHASPLPPDAVDACRQYIRAAMTFGRRLHTASLGGRNVPGGEWAPSRPRSRHAAAGMQKPVRPQSTNSAQASMDRSDMVDMARCSKTARIPLLSLTRTHWPYGSRSTFPLAPRFSRGQATITLSFHFFGFSIDDMSSFVDELISRSGFHEHYGVLSRGFCLRQPPIGRLGLRHHMLQSRRRRPSRRHHFSL